MRSFVILAVIAALCVASCSAVEERHTGTLTRLAHPKVISKGSASLFDGSGSSSGHSSSSSGGIFGSSSSSSSSSSGGKLPHGLKKPVIVNPLETPALADALSNIASVLGKEPAAAVANDQTALDAEETEEEAEAAAAASDDVTLMGEDDCDSPLPSEGGGCKKKKKKHGGGDAGGSEGGSGSESESGGASAKIRKLEHLIKLAMKMSKTIPENVRKLEALKAKEEQATESKARTEAVKTLEEHRRLMAEMANHIVKLRAKLNELISKRQQLEASDERLRKELQQMSESSSSGSK